MKTRDVFMYSLLGGAALTLAARALARKRPSEEVAAQTAPAEADYSKIDAYVAAEMQRMGLPGAALVIVAGERIVHLAGLGQAHPGGEAPAAHTPFYIGSTTKSFTALAVMQLVEAGKIELDAPLQRYLPWFRVADPQASAQISVRHLLNQTSGIPVQPGWQALCDDDRRPDAAERQARRLAAVQLAHEPGTAFEYSNVNYNLLGLVVAAASGEPFPAYVQTHIFDPLEMQHTYTERAAALAAGLATGHQSWFGFPRRAPQLPSAAGSLASGQFISCAEDMGHYLIAHLNGGRYREAQVLSPQGVAELHRAAVDASQWDIQEEYAMGWYVECSDERTVLWHSGLVPDFYTYMALVPEQNLGVALLFNIDHLTMQLTLTELGSAVVARVAGLPPQPPRFRRVPWIQRAMLLIPMLQLADVLITLGMLRRWRRRPGERPTRGAAWARDILLPGVPQMAFSAGLASLMNQLGGFLMLFAPDFTWLARICGGLAGFWVPLRTALILRALDRPAK